MLTEHPDSCHFSLQAANTETTWAVLAHRSNGDHNNHIPTTLRLRKTFSLQCILLGINKAMYQLSRRKLEKQAEKLKNKMSKKFKCSREQPAQTITVELGACPSAKSSKMINNSDICVHLALRGRSTNLISPYSTCGAP